MFDSFKKKVKKAKRGLNKATHKATGSLKTINQVRERVHGVVSNPIVSAVLVTAVPGGSAVVAADRAADIAADKLMAVTGKASKRYRNTKRAFSESLEPFKKVAPALNRAGNNASLTGGRSTQKDIFGDFFTW